MGNICKKQSLYHTWLVISPLVSSTIHTQSHAIAQAHTQPHAACSHTCTHKYTQTHMYMYTYTCTYTVTCYHTGTYTGCHNTGTCCSHTHVCIHKYMYTHMHPHVHMISQGYRVHWRGDNRRWGTVDTSNIWTTSKWVGMNGFLGSKPTPSITMATDDVMVLSINASENP